MDRRKERMVERLFGRDALVGIVAQEALEEVLEVGMLGEELHDEKVEREHEKCEQFEKYTG